MDKHWTIPVLALCLIFSNGVANASVIYWNLYNLEGENTQDSVYITYDSLGDMLNDTNRTGNFNPNTFGDSSQNVVGSGSDGMVYWNLFNLEGENTQDSVYITYDSLGDMLNDTNRTGNFNPNTFGGSSQNVVGSGASVMAITIVPEPATFTLLGLGLAGLGFAIRRRKSA